MTNLDQSRQKFVKLDRILGSGNYRKIAQRIGQDHRNVARVLGGKAPRPSADTLRKISSASGVSLDEVMWYIETVRRIAKFRARNLKATAEPESQVYGLG